MLRPALFAASAAALVLAACGANGQDEAPSSAATGAPVETRARTLQELIEEQGFPASAVATALDGSFIPRTARDSAALTEGARVEVLSPMQGG